MQIFNHPSIFLSSYPMKIKYMILTILTLFFSLLAIENLKHHFFFKFLISIFDEISPVKKRLMSSSFSLFTISAMCLSLQIWFKQLNKCNYFLPLMNVEHIQSQCIDDLCVSFFNYTWIFSSFLSIVAMLILGLLPRLKQDNREEVKSKLGEWHKQSKVKHVRVIA